MGYAEGLALKEQSMPLEQFKPEHRTEVEELAAADAPPPKWITFHDSNGQPFARIPSRAWFEWHWRRGMFPTDPEERRSVSTRLREAVIARDGLLCGLCGDEVAPEDIHVDHILPRSLGGPDELDNLQVAHALCNMRKGNRV